MDPNENANPKPRFKPKLNLNVSQLPPRRFTPAASSGSAHSSAASEVSNPAAAHATTTAYQTPVRSHSASDMKSVLKTSSHFKNPLPPTSSGRSSAYMQSSQSSLMSDSTPIRTIASQYGLVDPLTPSSRLNLDSAVAQGKSQATFYPSTPSAAPPIPDEPLSPNSALLSTLDAVSQLSIGSKTSSHFSFDNQQQHSSRSAYGTPSLSLNSSSTSVKRTTTFTTTQVSVTSSNQPNHVLRLGTGDNGNGGDIMYLSTRIRIRAGNIHCLRCRSDVSASGHLVSTVDAAGTGFDPDEIFVLVNVTMRSDEGRVRYSDTVAIYCISGASKGRFLSVDGARLTTKKGPIMSNAEKWRLGERDDFKDHFEPAGLEESLATLAPAVRNAQRTLQSGDRVYLKTYSSPYILCADEKGQVHLRDLMHEVGFGGWEITKASIPYNPPWNRDRAYLTGTFVLETTAPEDVEPTKSLQQLPLSMQERALVDDILFVLLGIEGRYIRKQDMKLGRSSAVPHFQIQMPRVYRNLSVEIYDHLHFVVDPAVTDPSLAALASKIVVLGEYYIHVAHYVETHTRYEYGQVCHAFCAALKVLLREYTVVVAQLEHLALQDGLSLSKIWFYIQPSMRAMEFLSTLIRSCLSHHGGALLSVIAQLPTSGDAKATSVLNFLLEKASVPYLKMLELWIYFGDLHDPYDEFMVASDDTLVKEELSHDPWSKYWEQRYTLRESHVPLFLTRFSNKILTTGKYLNVLRTCGRHVNCPFATSITHAESVRKYDELIDNAHGFASRILVDMLRTEQDLMNRLRSIKHYFLMDQGDFFVDFMDLAEAELNLRADKLLASRLESLLHLSLQSSTCSSDPYKDDLICILSPHDLISQMEAIHERSQKVGRAPLSSSIASSLNDPGYKAIDALTLDYKVKWPLSLVISSGALNKYQMIFRHLFFCKHVERRLCDAWRNHQSTKELALRSAMITSYCLRQRMLHFQQNFVYYMMFEVISPRWHALEAQLVTEVTTVDDILNCHRDFLDQCLKECLLTDPDLLRVLTKLMTVCLTFANSIDRFTRPYRLDEEAIRNEREAERDRRADKKARDEADAMLNPSQKLKTRRTLSAVPVPRRNSGVDLRRARIKELSDDVRKALTDQAGGGGENPFVKMTADLEAQFDTLLADFMQQLLHRSHLQYNSHLSNLCTRLDYNGFYTQ
ncbi:Aste57867_5071 [Aphanomyces stellatus]|uniref:Aste57867_5071 protein n=1 Tax=Aphanomyces stellatus TaxID=120398 RepID=A0A485KH80_9STRA|nr:hypothetical protein As57867_005058 [Aphanomyces stellatus]VFT82152.1 Aste57867_5071 [Aphanomyces stellatus]